ncbi:MAG: RIP metalloprotease RseP [Desulfovibrio sp.]
MTTTFAVILVLGGLIFFHELGHFLIARLFGMGVHAFSLGFGPKLFGFKYGETEYKLCLIPLGGYVLLAGENPEADEEKDSTFPDNKLFGLRPAWQRMFVVAAGPVFNFLLAVFIYWGIFHTSGQILVKPIVGEVQLDSAAMSAGLQSGDTILRVNNAPIESFTDLVVNIRKTQGEPLEITYLRDNKELDTLVTPKITIQKNIFGEEEKIPLIGIRSSGEIETIPLSIGGSAEAAINRTWFDITTIVKGIGKIATGSISAKEIGGPIMIAQEVGKQAKSGILNVLFLTAIISVNLGLLNLLPIPVLDGGHIVFFGFEALTGKPVSDRFRQVTTYLGLTFLFGLMGLAIFNDISRIITNG